MTRRRRMIYWSVVVFGSLTGFAACASEGEPDTGPPVEDLEEVADDSAEATSVADVAPASPPEPQQLPEGVAFFEDFVSDDSMAHFEFDIFHRDEHLGAHEEWPGDHPVLEGHDHCGPPEEHRTIPRGEISENFNDQWIYRCVPGGDRELAHLMTSIGDASGYSIGAFAPTMVFDSVSEIRWDINITDLGVRQFPEVKVIPVETFDFQDMPCAIEWLPCDTPLHGELGSVGTSFMGHGLTINNGTSYDSAESWFEPWMYEDDPALSEVRTRRENFFRDNGDGTLTFGLETPAGDFEEFTYPGSFPEGPVRVVFADHNYTPTKDDPPSFTWHWDNITILS